MTVSLAQALTRDGFALDRHSWSLLANCSLGWIQVTNFILTGLMTVAAAAGLGRALTAGKGRRSVPLLASVLEVVYLIFNAGYAATGGDDWMRPALCTEALRLGRILAGLAPAEPGRWRSVTPATPAARSPSWTPWRCPAIRCCRRSAATCSRNWAGTPRRARSSAGRRR
ncbi:DUF6596 domain-containing protein [Actinoplanes rectilineatus]|uniref:DUF6596 domain-containing protein n=1 Tax=Actinoplanes rectilineatus TaxID=113571 RepID=UPI000AB1E8BD